MRGGGVQPNTPRDLTQAIDTVFAAAIKAWSRAWEAETRGQASYNLTPRPTAKVLRAHKGVHRAVSSSIIQMRTEKIGLRKFLFNRKVPGIEDEECGCNLGEQTVKHVLLVCPRFADLRWEVWRGGSKRG